DIGQDGFQAAEDGLELGAAEHADLVQHASMGHGALNVVPVQPAIEVLGRRELFDELIRRLAEATGPKLARGGIAHPTLHGQVWRVPQYNRTTLQGAAAAWKLGLDPPAGGCGLPGRGCTGEKENRGLC